MFSQTGINYTFTIKQRNGNFEYMLTLIAVPIHITTHNLHRVEINKISKSNCVASSVLIDIWHHWQQASSFKVFVRLCTHLCMASVWLSVHAFLQGLSCKRSVIRIGWLLILCIFSAVTQANLQIEKLSQIRIEELLFNTYPSVDPSKRKGLKFPNEVCRTIMLAFKIMARQQWCNTQCEKQKCPM